ncbi:MAG: hypothetical protein WCX86_11695 [Candidatus Hydrogenedentales bacterium]
MSRFSLLLTVTLLLSWTASAQGVLSDILSGSLIKPEVGVYAWYEVKDTESGKTLFLRQAIVGEKEVKGKTGYYLETEVLPEIGFPIIYKMLLTGPASSPANVHEIMVREGGGAPESLPLNILEGMEEPAADGTRTSNGMEQLATPAGDLEAEHFVVESGGETTNVWVNEEIRPTGIVKMISPDGELLLTSYGIGGKDAESALERPITPEHNGDVNVHVEAGPTKNYQGKKKE